MNIEVTTVLLFGLMIVFLFLGLPLSWALGGVGVIFMIWLWGPQSMLNVPLRAVGQMRTFVLIAIPLFIFMAMVLERSGIADALYEMAYRWMGGIPGGLAIGTVLICTMFAAMAGISGAATVTMGLIALPSMLKRGYDKNIATGCIAAGGALGVLIPPSVMMILYALFAEESVGQLFAGGVIPGLILSGLFCAYIAIRSILNPGLCPVLPKEDRATWAQKFASLKAVVLPIILVIAVLGSIFFGVATPTEAAAVGAFGAVICALGLRRFSWKLFNQAAVRTMSLTSMIIWIVVGAAVFVSVYDAVGAKELIKDLMLGMDLPPMGVILVIQLTYFVLGCFLDPTGIIMITTPVFVPAIKLLGFDPVWFGVVFAVNMEMAFLTPPFGVNLFYLKGIVPEGVTMGDIYKAIVPFVALQAVGLAIVIIWPQTILWLPNLIFKG
ncbi:MAG: TRAP transporter large permease subunit [Dehalococcoidales bacterium]|nr:TRAP transporter large permease subunit [Dehalococcoidales bacterium]